MTHLALTAAIAATFAAVSGCPESAPFFSPLAAIVAGWLANA